MEKDRFSKKRIKPFWSKIVSLPVISILLMLVFFWQGLEQVEQVTRKEEEKGLEKAIMHSAVHSYATRGIYPENLKVIEAEYGVNYDKKKYLVDYEIFADNIMPKIQIIRLK